MKVPDVAGFFYGLKMIDRQELKPTEVLNYIESNEFRIGGEFKGKHIVSIEQFEKADLSTVFRRTEIIKDAYYTKPKALLELAQGKVMVPLFYEPSTRTDLSFQTAMQRIGGCVDVASNGVQFSSVYKGENLVDTVRALGCYVDVIAFRHPDKGSSFEAAWALKLLKQRGISNTSLISGGDGIGEHPTQALLDIYTILELKDSLDGLTVTMVGDLQNGRTVHSDCKALAELGANNLQVVLVSPESLKTPAELVERLNNKGITTYETDNLLEVIGSSDVVYWTRVQEERFKGNPEHYEEIKNRFVMTPNIATRMKADAIFLHPLPRKLEMGTENDHLILDQDPRFIYNEQMRNGMFVRMAMLDLVLNGNAN